MFEEKEIIEFFNRIINSPSISEEEINNNVTKFYEYLILTKMCDDELIEKISKIIACLNEILKIKRTMGYIDVNVLIQKSSNQKRLVMKPQNRHYNHYESSSSSSSCGSSTRHTSRC